MTNEEARKEYKRFRRILRGTITELAFGDVLDMMKEALEKQIPEKPLESDWIYCPACRKMFGLWGEFSFCPCCGQAIDWSEEECQK